MLFPERATAFIKRQIKLEQFYINLKHLKTSRNSINVPIPDLALPKAIPSLAVFAWKPFSGTANCSCLRHHAVWAIACHFVGFPKGNNYSRGIGDAWHPSKTKVCSRHNHQTSPETGKNYQEPMKSKHVPFPTHSHYGQREFFGLQWREYGRNRGTYARLGKLPGEGKVECHFVGFPGVKLI